MKTKGPLLNFIGRFNTNEACFKTLYDLKWRNGYRCRRCGCAETVAGKTQFHKRCRSCKYDESCTAHTLFHKLKFPIVKAFAIIFQLSTLKKGMSSCEISRQFGIHQETAWFFQKKVQLAILANTQLEESHNIQKIIDHLLQAIKNETEAAPIAKKKEEGNDGNCRSEIWEQGVLKKTHPNLLKKQLTIKKKKKKIELRNLITHQENRAKRTLHFLNMSFPGLHKILPIFKLYNVKNWLLGIHHKVSIQHLNKYLCEFLFKWLRRRTIKKSPFVLIHEFVKHSRTAYSAIIST
jgi:hypothetical protein